MGKKDPISLSAFDNQKLPTLPDIFLEFKKLISEPYISVKKIAGFILRDQSLVVKIVQLSNSAYYSKREQVESLPRAISYLGLDVIKNIVFQLTLIKSFGFQKKGPDFDPKVFWKHALMTAYISQEISKVLELPENENYYLGGLLHDFGQLLIYHFFPERFADVLAENQQGVDWLKAEKQHLGIDHTEIGGMLAERWGFSVEIQRGIQHHHRAESVSPSRNLLAGLIAVANGIAMQRGSALSWGRSEIDLLSICAWEVLLNHSNGKKDVESIIAAIDSEIEKISETVSLILS